MTSTHTHSEEFSARVRQVSLSKGRVCFNVSEILMESTLARRTGHLCRRKAGTTPYIRIQLLTDRNRALHHRRPPQITYPTKSRLLTLLIGCCLSLLLHPSLPHSLTHYYYYWHGHVLGSFLQFFLSVLTFLAFASPRRLMV